MNSIFISYCRCGGLKTAQYLSDSFRRDGYEVVFDGDSSRAGVFDEANLKRIDECSDFIIVLSRGCFDMIQDPLVSIKNDWLRQELAHALRRKKNVIPIMLGDFDGFPNDLPPDICEVSRMNGPVYSAEYIDEFYEKLKTEFLSISGQVNPRITVREILRMFLAMRLKQKIGVAICVCAIVLSIELFLSPSEDSRNGDLREPGLAESCPLARHSGLARIMENQRKAKKAKNAQTRIKAIIGLPMLFLFGFGMAISEKENKKGF